MSYDACLLKCVGLLRIRYVSEGHAASIFRVTVTLHWNIGLSTKLPDGTSSRTVPLISIAKRAKALVKLWLLRLRQWFCPNYTRKMKFYLLNDWQSPKTQSYRSLTYRTMDKVQRPSTWEFLLTARWTKFKDSVLPKFYRTMDKVQRLSTSEVLPQDGQSSKTQYLRIPTYRSMDKVQRPSNSEVLPHDGQSPKT
jgi:hypothetical protein